MIRIQFYNLWLYIRLLSITVLSSFLLIFILSRRDVYWKTLVRQIRVIRPRSKLNIIVFCVAINRHHTIFIWISSINRTSNCNRIILFLVKIWNIHLTIINLFDRSIISTFRSRSSHWLILTNFKRIWNDLNRLFSFLIICPIQLTWRMRLGMLSRNMTIIQYMIYLTFI